jgi:protein-S-isoprenylcysteine O-methyltransferase Ste14
MNLNFKKLKPYLLNVILIWLVILFYTLNPYYKEFLKSETQATLIYLGLAYTLLGLIYYLFISKNQLQETKGTLVFGAFKKIFKSSYFYFSKPKDKIKTQKIDNHEKIVLLFLLVKIFFLPIMLNFFFSNYYAIKNQFPNILSSTHLFTITGFNNIIFPFLLTLIFLIDTLWFSFGYTIETKSLKNTIRSVEPTIFGWMVALACYPPFNGIFTKYINWYANDYISIQNIHLTFILRIIIIALLAIYVGATLALGAKCSNLTNRGIVTKGPYSIVRHPAYISKNLAWWITIMPVLSIPAILSMATWSLIYHLRAVTEERHLIKDPDYVEYCKKVKYRYIPKIY